MEENAENELMKTGLQMARDYADLVLEGSLSNIGGILSDTIGNWRLKNQIRLLVKTKKYLEEKGVNPGKIVPDIFVPILEAGSYCSEESLSKMYASLLAMHIDANDVDVVHPSFSKILPQLSSMDVKILDLVMKNDTANAESCVHEDNGQRVFFVGNIAEKLKTEPNLILLSCQNLNRLGLLKHLSSNSRNNASVDRDDLSKIEVFSLTEFGISFHKACTKFGTQI